MKKLLLFIITGLLFSWAAMAQSIGINTTTPNANAVLDIKSSTKGILIPRTSTTSRLAIVNPPKGLILYDSTAGGFWFYNGAAWSALSTGNNAWSTTGNSGTDTAVNFIGTTDAKPLRFRINNNWAGQLDSINMALGIGSGQNMTSGNSNTAFGRYTLNKNSFGSANTAIGENALAANILGSNNTAVGNMNLASNTYGDHNSSHGYQSMVFNTIGSDNTAMGFQALALNTTASQNIAIGSYALFSQSFSNGSTPFNSDNVAIGVNALKKTIQ
jgi:hypothetical protein